MAEKLVQPFEYVGTMLGYEKKRFLLADEMGMFKTAQTIFIDNKIRAKKAHNKALVVCPTSVKEHWAREIKHWGYPKGQEVTLINAHSFDADISKAEKSDWAVIHYPLLSNLNNSKARDLYDLEFNHVVLDEVHNAKNPQAIRSQAVKELADGAEYLTLLSGTPMPNSIEDTYMLMHLLEPGTYPFNGDKNIDREARHRFVQLYWSNPQELKDLLHRRMVRREAKHFIGAELPELKEKEIKLAMEGEWLKAYNEVLEQAMPLGRKIMLLEKVLLDPQLAGYSVPSEKYGAVDKIVKKETKQGSKVLIFTSLKEGVVDELASRYERYGSIAITGDIESAGGKREELRKQFQYNPDTKVLIATTAMNEGVDLTAAGAVVNLTIPWTPAEYQQRFKRAHRPSEVKKDNVTVYNIIAEYPGRLRKSLDQAKWEMLKAKQRVVDYLMSGLKLSREELLELQEPNKMPRIKYAIKSDNQEILEHYMLWRAIGSKSALRRIENRPEKAKQIAEMYNGCNMARNSAELYLGVVKELEKEHDLDIRLDLAGGPGMLGYYSEKPTLSLDIDREMLRKGRETMPASDHVHASMSYIPLKDRSVDLVVCSLAFQMTEPRHERAKVLQNVNKVLKDDGYAIVVIPGNYLSNNDKKKFYSALDAYGFEREEKYSGEQLGPSKFDMYTLKKIGSPSKGVRDLAFYGDRGRVRK